MSWAHSQGGSVGSNNTTVSLQASLAGLTVGQFLCVGVVIGGAASPTLGDGQNAYTLQKSVVHGNVTLQIYTAPITTGGNLTLTLVPDGATARQCSIVWDQYSFSSGASVNLDGTGSNSAASGGPINTGNFAITTPDLGYAIAQILSGSITNASTPWAFRQEVAYATNTLSLASADYPNASTSPINATFTNSGGGSWTTAGIGLLASGGLPTSIIPPGLLGTANTSIF